MKSRPLNGKFNNIKREFLSLAGEEADQHGAAPKVPIMQNPHDTVLISTLLEEEPDLIDLVEVFLKQFPSYLERCQAQFAEQDWPALTDTLHSLVGMAGGYGYQIITDTARLAENELKNQNYEHISEHLRELEKLNDMAQRGYQGS